VQEPATTDPVVTPRPMSALPDPGPVDLQVSRNGHRGGRHSARLAFLAAALRSPSKVGAVFPSSGPLAELLATVVPHTGAPVVVEIGAGTGAVTDVVDARLPPAGRHLAVELDPGMVRYLRRIHPGLEVIQGDAIKIGTLLAERGVEHADAVLGGLPWALLDEGLQRSILEQIAAVVGPTGAFTTFAYTSGMVLPAARRFRQVLRETFEEVVVSATVWRNLPPAFAYVCRRPRAVTDPATTRPPRPSRGPAAPRQIPPG
jgi:phosphatidylethanolamine/phosphatidyl-N-methylethanolamine N-methyltransferase